MKWIITLFILSNNIFTTTAQEISFHILFDYYKYIVPDTSLLKIIKMISNQDIKHILLEGHCDSVGSRSYNILLSNQRVNEVKKILIHNGIEKNKIIKYIGFGKGKPINNNETANDRQLNRRVVITFFINENIKLDNIKIKLSESKEGENIILQNILFYGGEHNIREESIPILYELLKELQQNATVSIEIQGHVCCAEPTEDGFDIGTQTLNLSVNRAKEIYHFLIKNGIDKKRLTFKGFGGSRKLHLDESTELLKRENRRVELKILKK